MYISEETPKASSRSMEITRRKAEARKTYEAKVVDEPPRVVVVAVDRDDIKRGKHAKELPGQVEDQTLVESLEEVGGDLSFRSKQRLAAIVAGVVMLATIVLGSVISIPVG